MTPETAKALAALLPNPPPDPYVGRVYVLRLRVEKAGEPTSIRLRRLLKTAKRRDGFKCVSTPVLEEEYLREEKKEKSKTKTKRPTDAKRT